MDATEVDVALPYAGTSGWSGTDTSRERAERDDSDGTTARRQTTVSGLLRDRGRVGLTWKELAARTGWHHGQVSGALSVMHLAGSIKMLAERRDRCMVYVLPEFVDGRASLLRRLPKADRLLRVFEELCFELEDDGHTECADILRSRLRGFR